MQSIHLQFHGPLSFSNAERSLFHSQWAESAGVYLWTIKNNQDHNYYIHYIGETTQFAKRHREHLIHILGLNYGLIDPDKAQEGVMDFIWPGLWRRKTPEGIRETLTAYTEFHSVIRRYIDILDIFFAPLSVQTDVRKHIEGSIGWHLRKNYPKATVLYPDDNHIGRKKEKIQSQLQISTAEEIQGIERILSI